MHMKNANLVVMFRSIALIGPRSRSYRAKQKPTKLALFRMISLSRSICRLIRFCIIRSCHSQPGLLLLVG